MIFTLKLQNTERGDRTNLIRNRVPSKKVLKVNRLKEKKTYMTITYPCRFQGMDTGFFTGENT